jgi:Zn-dependent protease with chaperone function
VEDALLRWLRAAELTCDRAALLVAQDPAVVIGALMKLAGGSAAFAHELNVDAFLQQVLLWRVCVCVCVCVCGCVCV